jgi:hypothetical protein
VRRRAANALAPYIDYKKKNHNIDLLLSKEFLYELLYFFFKKKLSILQEYLLKNLTLNKIRKFISFVNASILFVLKSDNNLRLCVKYRNFNVIIIKNKCSLSLIEKTLDSLINVVYFIKPDLKNAYYRIRIR